MKKLIMLMALIIVAMVSFGQTRTGKVTTGRTTLDFPINFTAADSIPHGTTYYVVVDCKQNYYQTQSVAVTLDVIAGSSSVAVSLEGKTSPLDAYVEIVSASTYTTGSTPISLVTTVANKYRYFKIKFINTGSHPAVVKVIGLTFACTYSNLTAFTATSGVFTTSVTTPIYDVTGANGITFGSADVTKFTYSGISENLILTPSANTWTLSTTTGVTAIAAGGLNLTGVGTIGSGAVTSTGNIATTKKVAAKDSLCLGPFKFVVISDTLCSVHGASTLRIHPTR